MEQKLNLLLYTHVYVYPGNGTMVSGILKEQSGMYFILSSFDGKLLVMFTALEVTQINHNDILLGGQK